MEAHKILLHRFSARESDVRQYIKTCRDADLSSEDQLTLCLDVFRTNQDLDRFCQFLKKGEKVAVAYVRSLVPCRATTKHRAQRPWFFTRLKLWFLRWIAPFGRAFWLI